MENNKIITHVGSAKYIFKTYNTFYILHIYINKYIYTCIYVYIYIYILYIYIYI